MSIFELCRDFVDVYILPSYTSGEFMELISLLWASILTGSFFILICSPFIYMFKSIWGMIARW